jgi:hypothetical protein
LRAIAAIAASVLGRVARRAVPDGEGVVGVDAGAPAVAGLRVDEDASALNGLDLPLPPGAGGEVVLLAPAGAIARGAVPSIRPSTPRARASRRSSAKASQLGRVSTGESLTPAARRLSPEQLAALALRPLARRSAPPSSRTS